MPKPVKTSPYPVQNSLNNPQLKVHNAVEEVVRALLDRDYSENTRIAIFRDLKNFIEWYMKVNGEDFRFDRVTERDVRDYRDQAQKEGRSPATINRRLSTLSQFFKIAMERGYMEKDPTAHVKQLSKQPLAPKGLTKSEARKLLKEVDVRGNLRDRLVIGLMLHGGCRVSDVVGLHVHDVHISERKGHIVIRKGKGNKHRTVPLHKELRGLLSEYIKQEKPKDRLIVGQRGPLGSIAINKIVEKYAKKAQVKASPHVLRHTFGYNFLQEHPSDVVALSQILGHSNINTSAIYCQNRLEDLQEKVEVMSF